MRTRSVLSCSLVLALGASAVALAGCSDDPQPPGWTLRVRSQDVVVAAVHSLQIVIKPRELDRRFADQPSQSYEGGAIQTSVSAAGEFVVSVAGTWVTTRSAGVSAGTGAVFAVDVPMYATETSPAQMALMDPELRAYFIRNGAYIAQGQVYAPWPLPAGMQTQVLVICKRPEFGLECSNNDSMPTDGGDIDAGPGGTDAGPGGTDAGPGGTDAGPGATDAGPGATDAGPGATDAGPGATDAGPGATDAGPGATDAGPDPDAG